MTPPLHDGGGTMGRELLHRRLERAAARYGERDAILFGGQRWSFRRLQETTISLAGHLSAMGVQPGERVMVMTGNRPEFVAAIHAVSRLGAAAVVVSPMWKSLEVAHAVDVTRPVHGVCDDSTAEVLSAAMAVTNLDGDALAAGPLPPDPADASAEALMVFSSGTTGLPKAARHTHRSMAHAVRHWTDALGLGPGDRFQVATPPSHILGLLNLVTAVEAGAVVRMHSRFDLDEILGRIASERMTLEMAVAPIALAMANHPGLEKFDLSSLRYIMWGATPVTASVAETVTRRTGVRWLPAYGATELPVIAANPVARPEAWRLDSAGLPVPGVELRVVDLDTGRVLPPGQAGEIQARSPSLMAGYLPEEANTQAFSDGWYRTGDVGWLEPEGWVHLTDRSKEMIKVSGFQVAPAELEAVLLGHPSVVDCAVFGLPDERAGEVPVAAVVADPARPVTADELMRLVADSLAPYKKLRRVRIVDAIPRLPSGKALRRHLRDEWISEGGG